MLSDRSSAYTPISHVIRTLLRYKILIVFTALIGLFGSLAIVSNTETTYRSRVSVSSLPDGAIIDISYVNHRLEATRILDLASENPLFHNLVETKPTITSLTLFDSFRRRFDDGKSLEDASKIIAEIPLQDVQFPLEVENKLDRFTHEIKLGPNPNHKNSWFIDIKTNSPSRTSAILDLALENIFASIQTEVRNELTLIREVQDSYLQQLHLILDQIIQQSNESDRLRAKKQIELLIEQAQIAKDLNIQKAQDSAVVSFSQNFADAEFEQDLSLIHLLGYDSLEKLIEQLEAKYESDKVPASPQSTTFQKLKNQINILLTSDDWEATLNQISVAKSGFVPVEIDTSSIQFVETRITPIWILLATILGAALGGIIALLRTANGNLVAEDKR